MFGKIRLFYSIVSLLIVWLAIEKYSSFFAAETSITIDSLSYIGTIATLIALLITVLEVIHNVNVSKQIKDEASSILDRAKEIEKTSTISECLGYVNSINQNIEQNDFKSALATFRFFRTLNIRLNLNYFPYSRSKDLAEVEEKLISLIEAVEVKQDDKKWLTKDILSIKSTLEKNSPAKNAT